MKSWKFTLIDRPKPSTGGPGAGARGPGADIFGSGAGEPEFDTVLLGAALSWMVAPLGVESSFELLKIPNLYLGFLRQYRAILGTQ